MSFWSSLDVFAKFSETLKRFPVTLLVAISVAITITMNISASGDPYINLGRGLFAAFLTSLIGYFYAYSYLQKKWVHWMALLSAITIGSVVYFGITGEKNPCYWTFYFGVILILHFVYTLHFGVMRYQFDQYLKHNFFSLITWLQAAFFSFVIYLALTLVLLALKYLFGFNFDNKVYLQLFVLVAFIIHPIFFLSEFDHMNEDNVNYVSGLIFEKFVYYVCLPIVILFAGILYAYGIKILVTKAILAEWVSVMILWYLGAGIFTWFAVKFLLQNTSSKLLNLYIRWFPLVSILLEIFLILALRSNIQNSWIKEEFYFQSFLCVFALLFIVLSQLNDEKVFNMYSLSAIILASVAAFGPFSMCKIPIQNAQNLLILGMKNSGLIVHDTLVQFPKTELMDEKTRSVYHFLWNRNALDILRNYDKNQIIVDSLYFNDLSFKPSNEPRIEFDISEAFNHDIPKVSGYNYMLPIRNGSFQDKNLNVISQNSNLLFKKGDSLLCTLDISPILLKMRNSNTNMMEIEWCGHFDAALYISKAATYMGSDAKVFFEIKGYVFLESISEE